MVCILVSHRGCWRMSLNYNVNSLQSSRCFDVAYSFFWRWCSQVLVFLIGVASECAAGHHWELLTRPFSHLSHASPPMSCKNQSTSNGMQRVIHVTRSPCALLRGNTHFLHPMIHLMACELATTSRSPSRSLRSGPRWPSKWHATSYTRSHHVFETRLRRLRKVRQGGAIEDLR